MDTDDRAKEWLQKLLDTYGIEWEECSPATQMLLTANIPCTIRCFRVGGPVDLVDGVCPECGQKWSNEKCTKE